MTLFNRTPRIWMIGLLLTALAAQTSLTGRAFARENDDNEIVRYGPQACTVVADLPAFQPAVCVKHKTEIDDGVTETTNRYVTGVAANTVQQAFTSAFQQYGWIVVEAEQDLEDQTWEYTVRKGLREVEVEVEAQDPDEGGGTTFTLKEE